MKTGIIVAMEKELMPLLKLLGDYTHVMIMKISFFIPNINANTVIALSGVGELNASITSMILYYHFNVEKIINYGYVGALYQGAKLGDLVNVSSVVHCDIDLTAFGNMKGQYDNCDFREYIADSEHFRKYDIQEHLLLSSDKYYDDIYEKGKLIQVFGNGVCDMEGAGIAVTCKKIGIPFSMIKCVSNRMYDTKDVYLCFSQNGINKCVEILYRDIIG